MATPKATRGKRVSPGKSSLIRGCHIRIELLPVQTIAPLGGGLAASAASAEAKRAGSGSIPVDGKLFEAEAMKDAHL